MQKYTCFHEQMLKAKAVSLHWCQDGSSCPANAIQIGQAAWANHVAITNKTYSVNLPTHHVNHCACNLTLFIP